MVPWVTFRLARFAFPIRLKWWVKLLSARVDPCCWTRAPRAVKRRGPCSAELCFSALCSVLWTCSWATGRFCCRAGCTRDPQRTYRYGKKGLGRPKRGNSALLAIVLVRSLPAYTLLLVTVVHFALHGLEKELAGGIATSAQAASDRHRARRAPQG